MAKVISFVCDFCGELLEGDNRRTNVRKPFISIRGKMSLQNEPVGGGVEYIFLSEKEEIDYRFCNPECFGQWVEMKRTKFNNYRTKRLREEAQFENDNPYR